MDKHTSIAPDPQPARGRILHAAMETFIEFGYAEASTLKIAKRARVSKRELYALFGSKHAMLAACIAERAAGIQLPERPSPPRTRAELEAMLAELGASVLNEVADPGVVEVFRLAILEAQRAPEVAATLEASRRSVRETLREVFAGAQSAGLLGPGEPGAMAERYLALLWGDLMLGMLLRVRETPEAADIERRARSATADLLRLYAKSGRAPIPGTPKSRSH